MALSSCPKAVVVAPSDGLDDNARIDPLIDLQRIQADGLWQFRLLCSEPRALARADSPEREDPARARIATRKPIML